MGFKLQSATPLNPMRCSNRECGDELHGKDRVNQGTKTTPIVLVPHSLFIMIHYIEHLVHIFIFVHCHFTLNLWDFVWFFLSTLAVCPFLTPHCGVVETRERTLWSWLNSFAGSVFRDVQPLAGDEWIAVLLAELFKSWNTRRLSSSTNGKMQHTKIS